MEGAQTGRGSRSPRCACLVTLPPYRRCSGSRALSGSVQHSKMLRYVEGSHDDRFDHEHHVNPSIYLASRLHNCFVFVSGIKANQRHIVLRNPRPRSLSHVFGTGRMANHMRTAEQACSLQSRGSIACPSPYTTKKPVATLSRPRDMESNGSRQIQSVVACSNLRGGRWWCRLLRVSPCSPPPIARR